ncbi:tripartite motif-containing protein 16-like [Polypterus senegalus]|uniref:tripartite motif-containing protein 16-like n=1 Tax=Polypterus senegalus TaxID=55291 RepID=UPI001964E728|nr:tripartite motif-containing protein 16-like [Polypterus senegalus]
MAQDKHSGFSEKFICSVCLEMLNDPVTIPCGHNYCMCCIKKYWDREEAAGIYSCPLCREEIEPRPELTRNTLLADVTELLRDMAVGSSLPRTHAGPVDVTCDFCTGEIREAAAKTCVTCMASYCVTHLQPHRESEAFKTHRLEEPTGNLKQKLCSKHHKLLEMFCRTDQTCVCLMCAVIEHRDHDLVTPDVETAEKQGQMDMKRKEMKRIIWKKEEQVALIKAGIVELRNTAQREIQECEKTFISVLQSIERLRVEVTMLIRDHEEREVKKAKEHKEHLEKQIEELKMRDDVMLELLKMDDHICFLQKFPSVRDIPRYGDTPSIPESRCLFPVTLKMDLCNLKKHLNTISCLEFVENKQTGLEEPSYILQNLMEINFLLKYAWPLTLDPNTINGSLRISEENTMVKFNTVKAHYPIHPDRFERWPQVLCREALFGRRYYWEVKWSGEHADIGVAYNDICRKGGDSKCLLGGNDKSWSLVCSDSRYSVRHNGVDTLISAPSSQTIGVYLDWHDGTLSFYSISDTLTLLFRFHTTFTQPLYPGFRVTGSVKICQLN